jgi:hypothetical protein
VNHPFLIMYFTKNNSAGLHRHTVSPYGRERSIIITYPHTYLFAQLG